MMNIVEGEFDPMMIIMTLFSLGLCVISIWMLTPYIIHGIDVVVNHFGICGCVCP